MYYLIFLSEYSKSNLDLAQFMSDGKDPTALRNELQKLYDEALGLLHKNQHEKVQEIFNFFFQNDIKLKEKLAKAFSPKNADHMMDPEKMQSLIEMQAMYNNFHLNLFNQITDHLIDSFQNALKLMDQNLDEGSKASFEAQKLVRFYEVKLDKLMAPIETIQGSLYNDLKESYKTIIGRRNEMVSKLAQKVLTKESELMEKTSNT